MKFTADELKAKGYELRGGEWRKSAWPSAAQVRNRAFVQTGRARKDAKLESNCGYGTVGALSVQKDNRQRFLVRVTSFRHRLLDEDNLCEKYHVDLCRYAGALPSDAPGSAKIEVAQTQIGSKELEFTRIEIWKMTPRSHDHH